MRGAYQNGSSVGVLTAGCSRDVVWIQSKIYEWSREVPTLSVFMSSPVAPPPYTQANQQQK